MANSMYAHGRENFILGNIDWDGDTIKVVLVDEGDDVPSIADDEDLADRAAPSRVATSGALANASCSGGVADTDDVTISTVSGDEFESLDIYKDSGTEGTSWLICNIDTAGKAIIHQAHKAEEIAKAEKVIGDGAFLIRSGAPFGISDNPDILKEATKEAQYNDELRKMMPSGVKSTTIFGAPTIIQHKPRRNGNGNKL